MTVASFLGCFLLGAGPGFTIFAVVIAPKPFLVLIVLTSAFYWLLSLIFVAGLWRAFMPLGPAMWPYIAVVFSAVVVQEAMRVLYWQLHVRLERGLESIAASQMRPRLTALDKIEMALAGGLGQGAAHSALFFLSLLTPLLGPATFYNDQCPYLPFFAIAALASLPLLLLHTFGMVVSFDGFANHKAVHQAVVPVLHLAAGFVLLVNFIPGGCLVGLPLVWVCTVAEIALCAKIVWDRTGHAPAYSTSLRLHP